MPEQDPHERKRNKLVEMIFSLLRIQKRSPYQDETLLALRFHHHKQYGDEQPLAPTWLKEQLDNDQNWGEGPFEP